MRHQPTTLGSAILALTLLFAAVPAHAAGGEPGSNEPGILEPVTSFLQGRDIRVPNTDQTTDDVNQANVWPDGVAPDAIDVDTATGNVLSMLGHPITHLASPNEDMFYGLMDLASAAGNGDLEAARAAAREIRSILLGTTRGRIYDGFSMLNFNRWNDVERTGITAADFPPDAMAGEYKMKLAVDSGETFESPFDGEERKIWTVDINMLYYDGQIDSDTFLVRFPFGHHPDDVLHVNYRIFSMVQEDFSPTLVMLDRREAQNTVQFPFKGFDAVWIGFEPGQVLEVTVKYPPIRMIRGVYDWGWRVHPPRIQFLQPIYEIKNAHNGEIELDPQGVSFAYRNREELTLEAIGEAAPEMKMYRVVEAVLGDDPDLGEIADWLTVPGLGPRGTWVDWADLAIDQTQLPDEAWDVLAAEDGLGPGDLGDYQMVTAYMNNEMYGQGPDEFEIRTWKQRDSFRIKLVNLDRHTHYFRNVDFGARLHDDILRCCGGGETSFEIMNFKPTFGAPKVAEMQWRAGWGFRPHYDVLQQQEVFARGKDRMGITPYTSGDGGVYYGYQYSAAARGGDFRFSPPPFVITNGEEPAASPLRDADGLPGLVIGQRTPGYGVAKMCPDAPYPGFCPDDIAAYNPNGAVNWPPPKRQSDGTFRFDEAAPECGGAPAPCELRFPPFLRNPCQGEAGCGDIIPPTGAWRPFLWYNPANGTIWIDPDDRSQGFWADRTFSHGAPVFAVDDPLGRSNTLSLENQLPRASAQVFYQFDDLFHDNSIFSPHPIFRDFEPPPGSDTVEKLRVSLKGGDLRVRGRLSEVFGTGGYAEWVTIHAGEAGAEGCGGEVVGWTAVDRSSGRFIFRQAEAGIAAGSAVCVESTVSGAASAVAGR